jgi:putative acyl-CoA dehydrogenase
VKSLASADAEAHARVAVERLAQLAAAAALTAGAPPAVAEAFARTRLGAAPGATFGTSALDTADIAVLLDRALP